MFGLEEQRGIGSLIVHTIIDPEVQNDRLTTRAFGQHQSAEASGVAESVVFRMIRRSFRSLFVGWRKRVHGGFRFALTRTHSYVEQR